MSWAKDLYRAFIGNRSGRGLSAEEHLSELKGQFDFEANLSSTVFERHFKTVRATYRQQLDDNDDQKELARHKQLQLVVKIFPRHLSSSEKSIHPLHDLAQQLSLYAQEVDEMRERIYSQFGTTTNCLPFHQVQVTKHAVFLLRQFVKHNLYDRLGIRPYLQSIEKRWIAFQLLHALKELHSLDMCHGDVKIENVLVNSFLWVSLADLASYKPVYLSKDHSSADFIYFFDISGRRTCCLAPERVKRSCQMPSNDDEHDDDHLDDDVQQQQQQLTPAMDIFSLGCVLAEMFTERPLFDFSHLISYADRVYDPRGELKRKIRDKNLLDMITSMLSVDPCMRKSAHDYLNQQHGRAFPAFFLPLKNYMAKLVSTRLTADEVVVNLKRNLPVLIENFGLQNNSKSWYRNFYIYSTSILTKFAYFHS